LLVENLNVSFFSFPFANQIGGLNSQLKSEINKGIPLVSTISTIIFGMDVSHGSPGRSDVPSVAAVSNIFCPCFLFSGVRNSGAS
jgi:hypothetical protein